MINLDELYQGQMAQLDKLREELKEAQALQQSAIDAAAANETPAIPNGPSPQRIEEQITFAEGNLKALQKMIAEQEAKEAPTPTVAPPETGSPEAEFAAEMEDKEAKKEALERGVEAIHEALVVTTKSQVQSMQLADAMQKDVVGAVVIASVGAAMIIKDKVESHLESRDERIEKAIAAQQSPSLEMAQANTMMELAEKHGREKRELADTLKEQKKAFDERHADKSEERRAELEELRQKQVEEMRRELEARQQREMEERARQLEDQQRTL